MTGDKELHVPEFSQNPQKGEFDFLYRLGELLPVQAVANIHFNPTTRHPHQLIQIDIAQKTNYKCQSV